MKNPDARLPVGEAKVHLPQRAAAGFAWNQFGRSTEYLIIYLQSVLIARSLGAELYGTYALLLGFVQLTLSVSSLGLETVTFSYLPRTIRESQPGERAGVVRSLFLVRLGTIVMVAVFASLAKATFGEVLGTAAVIADYALVLLWYFALRSLNSLLAAYRLAAMEFRRVFFVTVSARCVEIVGVYLLLSAGYSLQTIFWFLTGTACAQGIGLSPRVGQMIGPINWESMRPIVGLGGKYWLSSLMEFLLGRQADILLLGIFFIDRASIGQYDAALSLAQGLNTVTTMGLYGISITMFASLPGESSVTTRGYWEALARAMTLLVIPILVFSIIHANSLITVLYSGAYLQSVTLFQIAALVYAVTRLLGGGVSGDYLSARARTDILLRAALISGLANLLLAIVLIPWVGTLGALVATGVAALMSAGIHANGVRRTLNAQLPWSTGLRLGFIGAISALLLIPFGPTARMLHFAAIAFAYGVLFLLIAYIVKPLASRDVEVFRLMDERFARVAAHFVRYPQRHGPDRGSDSGDSGLK